VAPASEFEDDLVRYLGAVVDEKGRGWWTKVGGMTPDKLRNYDFSAAGVKLIGSVPGRHRKDVTLHLELRV
jgi:tyrosyl-DNA phosphodiesterase-1